MPSNEAVAAAPTFCKLGDRLKIPAAEVLPGDFTTFSGFRQAVDVRKVRGHRVSFRRVDGTQEAVDRDRELVVFRQP